MTAAGGLVFGKTARSERELLQHPPVDGGAEAGRVGRA